MYHTKYAREYKGRELIIFNNAAHPMNAYITTRYKRSCLQFHMSSPRTIIFHRLAIFIKWDFIFDKGFKHLPVILLITASRPSYVKELSQKVKRETNTGKLAASVNGNVHKHKVSLTKKNRQYAGNQQSLWLIMDVILYFANFLYTYWVNCEYWGD